MQAFGKQGPSQKALEGYRDKITEVERAAGNLRLPVQELQASLNDFFEKMAQVVTKLEQSPLHAGGAARKTGRANKRRDKLQVPNVDIDSLFEWLFNKAQAERILENLEHLGKYNDDRSQLHKPIDRFIDLVNSFLAQTGKSVALTSQRGVGPGLEVVLSDDSRRPLFALSSGERQIVVMLAHLALNKRLVGSGVFIVDEPELSLHLSWQERFVEAIRAANPTVQIILATHSPAIILDRDENCRSLSPE